jgi:hypothetical protein
MEVDGEEGDDEEEDDDDEEEDDDDDEEDDADEEEDDADDEEEDGEVHPAAERVLGGGEMELDPQPATPATPATSLQGSLGGISLSTSSSGSLQQDAFPWIVRVPRRGRLEGGDQFLQVGVRFHDEVDYWSSWSDSRLWLEEQRDDILFLLSDAVIPGSVRDASAYIRDKAWRKKHIVNVSTRLPAKADWARGCGENASDASERSSSAWTARITSTKTASRDITSASPKSRRGSPNTSPRRTSS